MEITRGKVNTAKKVVVYGSEGIGKTTFAAQFPDPVFIDTEGSTKEMDVARLPFPKTWDEVLEEVDYVIQNPTCCKTLVVDSIDWAERLCHKKVCEDNKWKSINEPAYGKGQATAYAEFSKLIAKLTEVVSKGVNVCCVAHAKLSKFEQPDEMGSYDRWEMKLQNGNNTNSSQMVKEWADIVLFCNYKTFVNKGEGLEKNKVSGGRRVMYATHHPCWDAKNRHGLPDEMDFDFACIKHLFCDPKQAVRDLAARDGVDLEAVAALAVKQGHVQEGTKFDALPEKIVEKWAIKYWSKIVEAIKNVNKEEESNG